MKYWILLLMLTVTHAQSQNNPVIPLEHGLTLAHVLVNGEDHTIAVTSDKNGSVSGVNLTRRFNLPATPISMFNKLGFESIAAAINETQREQLETFDYAQLLSPAGKGQHHIALGLNYTKHADEVGQAHRPFLFIKQVMATREENIRYAPERLLDYEVEICARSLSDIPLGSNHDLNFAYFLCGDFTDRNDLVLNIDHQNLQSGKGFSRAKSVSGYFPTGPYMVIPKDQQNFLSDISLALRLNGVLKQRSSSKHLIWDLETALDRLKTLHNVKSPTYSEAKQWLPNGYISSEMNILTGTPEGVIMRPPSTWYRVRLGMWYFISFAFLREYESPRDYVIQHFLAREFNKKSFLQPGDQLVLTASWLGSLHLTIQ